MKDWATVDLLISRCNHLYADLGRRVVLFYIPRGLEALGLVFPIFWVDLDKTQFLVPNLDLDDLRN